MRRGRTAALAVPAWVLALVLPLLLPTGAAAADRERFDTRVFARVQEPGFPAYVLAHRNGRVHAGTYTDPGGSSRPSLVREWTAGPGGRGTLQRTWTVPGEDLSADHGVQVAQQDRRGRLILLEKSKARVMTLDPRTGRFRTWARIPDLPTCSSGATPCSPNAVDQAPIPNYAAWGPGGALYVTDYAQAVVWRLGRRTRTPRPWFTSPALDGSEFGTAGVVFRPGRRDLLLSQQSTTVDASLPTDGKLYRLPIRRSGEPGRLRTLWTSRPGDLPDGFGIGRSGRIYLANAGLSNQLVVLSRRGEELERFPSVPGSGDNGSSIPFDTPSNATFRGRSVLVANQSFTGDRSHHAILDVHVGERGRRTYVPRTAVWR